MSLIFTKPEPVTLKGHGEFTEKWVQQRIIDDPSLLGLGDVELVAAEKIQPKAGRLDLLLHDDQLNRRYEVELMLGATDPSHIMRTIEYWDIERRRYPAYDHVGVLVAEDITSRFLNLIALLSGSIPLIAIQMRALKVDDKIVLHFARVLDQTELRTDDEYELGDRDDGGTQVNRGWWEQRVPSTILDLGDEIVATASQASGAPCRMQYLKRVINIVTDAGERRGWLRAKQTLLHVGAYVGDAEAWVKRFDDAGLSASLKRGNKTALVKVTPETFQDHKGLLAEFIRDAFGEEMDEVV